MNFRGILQSLFGNNREPTGSRTSFKELGRISVDVLHLR